MIQLPNLPHDNLYKFLAFAGLAVMISTWYLYFWMEGRLREVQLSVIEADLKMTLEEDSLNDRMKIWRSRSERLDEMSPEEITQWREWAYGLIAEKDEEAVKKIEATINKKRQELLEFDHHSALLLALLSTCAGFICVVIGGRKWYSKIQKPQDQLLAATAALNDEQKKRRPRLKP